MNGARSSRRTASPVRVSLAARLGSGLDGAWWPRTGAMVGELPDLVEALHPALGDIVDININWSAGSAIPVLSTTAPIATAKVWNRHRLMVLCGRSAGAKLLVVPPMTPAPLAVMVLRHAAARHIPHADRASPAYEAADRVIRASRAEIASWEAEQPGRDPGGSSSLTADG